MPNKAKVTTQKTNVERSTANDPWIHPSRAYVRSRRGEYWDAASWSATT